MGDRPFGGDGSRYQNVWGNRPHWWNFSYDTHSQAGRFARGVAQLVWLTVIIWFIVVAVKTAF